MKRSRWLKGCLIPSVWLGQSFSSALRRVRQEARAAQNAAEDMMALTAEHGFIRLGRLFCTAGRGPNRGATRGLRRYRKAWPRIARQGRKLNRPYWLSLLGEACERRAASTAGLSALKEALAAADEHEIRLYEPEMHRLKGELLLKQDHSNAAKAHSCFQRASEIARKQSAKSLELRATMSLARSKSGRW